MPTSNHPIVLRREQPQDYRSAESLAREAFWNRYEPGCCEHYLLHIMRDADSFIHELDTVAVADGKIVGHIVYTRASVIDDHGNSHEVISFGPISVLPEFQGKGIGSVLIESTKATAAELGYKAIFIYGDPDYYGRFGFKPAEAYGIGTADNMYAPALQVLELVPGALSNLTGRFFEDPIFHVDPTAAEAFDKSYSPRELRDDLPSQLRFRQLISMRRPRR